MAPQDSSSYSAPNLPPAFRAAFRSRSIHLVSGKGGVGRTTVAVSIAKALAQQGYRTLVAEVDEELDAPSPLGLALGLSSDQPLSSEVREIAPQLSAVRLTGRKGQELFLTSLFKVESIAKSLLGMEALQKLARVAPSLRELGVFYHLGHFMRSLTAVNSQKGSFDRIVLDLPATGHFLGMTALPDLILELMPRGPIAQSLKEGQSYLYDPSLAAGWIVTLPEMLPTQEALELLDGLKKNHLPVMGVLLNRVPALIDTFSSEDVQLLKQFQAGPGSVAAYRMSEALRVRQDLLDRASVSVGSIYEVEQASSSSAVVKQMTSTWVEWMGGISEGKSS